MGVRKDNGEEDREKLILEMKVKVRVGLGVSLITLGKDWVTPACGVDPPGSDIPMKWIKLHCPFLKSMGSGLLPYLSYDMN
jgi:hypothetical protein